MRKGSDYDHSGGDDSRMTRKKNGIYVAITWMAHSDRPARGNLKACVSRSLESGDISMRV